MTEPTPPHLDLDALADALAGQADTAAVGHLTGCASCSSRYEELRAAEARVVAGLAQLPPPQVPADLAARLNTALAAQAPLRAAPQTDVTPFPSPSPRRRSPLAAAAAAVLLVAGGGVGYALLQGGDGRGGSGDTASTAAGGAAGPELVLNSSGTDWSDPAAVGAALPAVLEGRANAGAPDQQDAVADTAAARAPSPTSGSAAGSEAGSAAETRAAAPAPAPATVAEPLTRLRTPQGLADCLAALLPPDEPEVQPLALDYAQYKGVPALAVILPDPDPEQLSIFVVGEGCSRADDSTLFFVRVPKP